MGHILVELKSKSGCLFIAERVKSQENIEKNCLSAQLKKRTQSPSPNGFEAYSSTGRQGNGLTMLTGKNVEAVTGLTSRISPRRAIHRPSKTWKPYKELIEAAAQGAKSKPHTELNDSK